MRIGRRAYGVARDDDSAGAVHFDAEGQVVGQVDVDDRPASRRDLDATAGMPVEQFQLSATTAIDLPAGKYRFFAKADDGVRLYVNGKRAIDYWWVTEPVTHSCELDLEAGLHELKVEFFQGGGPFTLWVWAAPAAEHRSLARGAVELELGAVERDLKARPDDTALLASRAKLLMRASRFDEAAEQYVRLVEREPENHWHGYYRACLLAYLGKSNEWRDHSRLFLKRVSDDNDYPYDVLERATKSALLLPDAERVPELRGLAERARSVGGDHPSWIQPWTHLLMGLAEYRAGRFDDAIGWLEKCRAVSDHPSRTAAADALLAMAHHRLGNPQAARSALTRCAERMEKDLPAANSGDLTDTGTAIENWLIAHVLLREAEALIRK